MAADRVILGDGEKCVYSTDSNETGLNNNVLIVGSSGCGKTMSVSEARLLETNHSSLIITVTKRRIVKKYWELMKERGYEVLDLNFVHPEEGNVGYDPLDDVKEYQDIPFISRGIVMANPRKERTSADPYWDEAAVSLLNAEIVAVLMTEENPTFEDVLLMHENLTFEEEGDQIKTNYDKLFAYLEKTEPSCFAVSCWKSFTMLPIRTARCVYGALNTTIDSIFTSELRTMFRKKKKIDFRRLASRKTVLFVTSSPVNPALNCLISLFYGHAFKQLFEFGEEQPNGRLPIPVHFLADDFATGCPVQLFSEYISIFREKGIGVSLLIQSESQLNALYGNDNATTIINNCDTYLYMGSMDLHTAQNISLRVNRPLEDVLYMPVGEQILFRRGQKPIIGKRYNILENELYQRITDQYEKRIAARGDCGRG